ncbi:MAG: class IV adenylate cyclase [Planctomycetaceae bacterium]|jgi:adenylate cyclase class 2
MLEVELKYRVAGNLALRTRLAALGGVCHGEVGQRDQYFNHPQRDFAQTDEAVRVRTVGDTAAVTYKGPLVDKVTKTREEIEVELAGPTGGAGLEAILLRLGFRPVLAVEKRRERWLVNYAGREIEVACDQVAGLGEFVELETAAEQSDLAESREVLLRLAEELGLPAEAAERRGYLTLLLAGRGESSGAGG